jgi:hypothetical protein
MFPMVARSGGCPVSTVTQVSAQPWAAPPFAFCDSLFVPPAPADASPKSLPTVLQPAKQQRSRRALELAVWCLVALAPLAVVAVPALLLAFGTAAWPAAVCVAGLLLVCLSGAGVLRCLDSWQRRQAANEALLAKQARDAAVYQQHAASAQRRTERGVVCPR